MPAKLAKADITPVRQRSQYTCMAASLSMALKCHGQQHCDEDTVNKVMGAQPMRGASWEQALACAQHYGMRGTLTSPCTLKQLKAWTDAGTPVLIAWNPEGREWSHASLVFDVDEDENVHVADPNIPDPEQTVRVVPKSEFYAKWYEKWPDYLVRRPAMAIEREITPDGRQVMAGYRRAKVLPEAINAAPVGTLAVLYENGNKWAAWRKVGPKKTDWRGQVVSPSSPDGWKDATERQNREPYAFPKLMSEVERGDVRLLSGNRQASRDYDAGGLTQPLMTRRDYGVTASMKAKDYAAILKYAVNLPADVERYVEEVKEKNPSYSEGQAWATAWSIYCKYKNPDSGHCKQDSSDYFAGRTAKFPAGESMTVDEVADVVGPEFKEMNEDPPASVVKVRKEMEKKAAKGTDSVWVVSDPDATSEMGDIFSKVSVNKLPELVIGMGGKEWRSKNTAIHFNEQDAKADAKARLAARSKKASGIWSGRRTPLLAKDTFAEMLRDGKFEKGVPADPTENMTEEDAAEWERQNEMHKDEFKTADLDAVLHRDDDGTVPFDLFFNRSASEKRNPYAQKMTYEDFKKVYFKGEPVKDVIAKEFWSDFNYAFKGSLSKYIKETSSKTAAVTAGGKWGFTKSTETACTAGVNKLQKAAKRIANALYAKDEGSVAFLQKHAAKGGSKTASMLLKAMEDIGPAAMIRAGKTAGRSGNGMYGFSEKTAKLGLDACSALRHEAGVIAADLFARKGADPMKVAGYLAANAKKGKCSYSAMLAEVAPDAMEKVSKRATDFLASDESADDEVADIISRC